VTVTPNDHAAMLLARDAAGDREHAASLAAQALATVRDLGMVAGSEHGLAIRRHRRNYAAGYRPRRPRSMIERLKLMRDNARAYRDASAQRSFEHPTLRANFLAAKQLVHLERHGRMYVRDEAILGDRAFREAALAEPQAH
jgi:hypothetical protein